MPIIPTERDRLLRAPWASHLGQRHQAWFLNCLRPEAIRISVGFPGAPKWRASFRGFYFREAELLVELFVGLAVDLDIRIDEVI
jgi:hypothetical protein